ncbi:uncharacterized protein LOC129705019 [Leucoraja erinacea]|uniref:uncharacterized protein LOC129705019 n=1 Tax=Leucoraja erinaceus TaxID=7782 RepID=UPI0024551E43|nr:uncharacterized protein LOC129705019 [Leucoraja erinacea]
MVDSISSDSSVTEDSEEGYVVFCAIHVVNTHSKVIAFSEKSFKKSHECAAKWIEVEESLESKVAAEALQHKHVSQCVGPVKLEDEGHAAAGDDDDDDDHSHGHGEATGTGRRQQCIPGYHAECYRHFCNITTINRAIARFRKKKDAEKPKAGSSQEAVPDGEPHESAPKRLLRSMACDGQQTATDRRHVPPVQCIICKGSKYIKEQATGKRQSEKLVRCETKHGGQLLTAATLKQDEALLLHIRDKNLVAMEARYHKSCYLRYTRVVIDFANIIKQDNQQQVYEKSYSSFCKSVVEERIIRGKEILRLAKLNQLLIKEIREVEGLDASSHKAGHLKARLKKSYPVLCFTRLSRQVESDIVFVESLAVEELVEGVRVNSNEDGESSKIVGENQQGGSSSHHLRDMFHAAHIVQNSIVNSPNPIQWPLTSADSTLDKAEEIVPTELYNFLAWTTGASSQPKESGKVVVPDELHHRLLSVAQDVMDLKRKDTPSMEN